jgi:hypothetical protein
MRIFGHQHWGSGVGVGVTKRIYHSTETKRVYHSTFAYFVLDLQIIWMGVLLEELALHCLILLFKGWNLFSVLWIEGWYSSAVAHQQIHQTLVLTTSLLGFCSRCHVSLAVGSIAMTTSIVGCAQPASQHEFSVAMMHQHLADCSREEWCGRLEFMLHCCKGLKSTAYASVYPGPYFLGGLDILQSKK